MKTSFLRDQIVLKKSFLCLGLDSDLDKIPKHLLNESDPIFTFNKILLDSLNKLIVAVKINTAFYEAYGHKGWKTLERTIKYINKNYPDLFTIADAKRGDIGNTSDKYAKAFFSNMDFDSVTVSPYMGNDSVEPFLAYNNKHTILLALTSNKGSNDFQISSNQENNLFKKVLKISKQWKNSNNLMYVVGATKASFLKDIRSIVPNSFLLIPGIGAQGGDLKETFKNGANKDIGLLVNSSRSIIYAGDGEDFIKCSYNEAHRLQQEMQILLND
ncbi:MAG: orotidine-5'-phosphate decarboxylase [Flavobacteriaceae bacterium]|jgi:orotidine-5'-phosphate decarboxylase|nr:orotidine-5'-phosphate decarboxylase [Flavobacteriaceae bacterium]RZP06432.1 MAG: orotidine-5'-phosphate decarboxylase [Flavobacteriales bacterium]